MNTINLTFVSAPKKYNSAFNKKTKSLTIIGDDYEESWIGKAAFIGGRLFCFWRIDNKQGVTKEIEFYFENEIFSSNNPDIRIELINVTDYEIPYMYRFEIIKESNLVTSHTFISQAYNSYLLDVTFDDNDLEEDEVLLYFMRLWNSVRARNKKGKVVP